MMPLHRLFNASKGSPCTSPSVPRLRHLDKRFEAIAICTAVQFLQDTGFQLLHAPSRKDEYFDSIRKYEDYKTNWEASM